MNRTAFSSYAKDHGGRVIVLFLLFLLALYELVTAGLPVFAAICMLPLVAMFMVTTFGNHMFIFWTLMVVNYFIMWHAIKVPLPQSAANEMLEILLLVLAIIDVGNSKFNRTLNLMFVTLIVWCGYCTLEILNDTCGLGINIGAWYQGARLMAFQLMYTFLVFTIYISTAKRLATYLLVWAGLSLFAVFWVWKQKNIGFTPSEFAWLYGPGQITHVLQGGTLIRYFSVYSDSANFGIGIASTAVAFIIFGITTKIKKHKTLFLITGIGCAWAIFISGTRTGIVCLMAGIMAYVFLSKSFKIAIPVTVLFGFFAFILVFTNIGNGNTQIRRMRSAFDSEDASANVRKQNQRTMKKYMAEAPWGIGLGMFGNQIPPNNKFRLMSTIPADSEYVFIWLRTGRIGITTFLICTAIMIFGACWIVFFRLRSPSLRGIGAGLTCAMISQQLGGYGNMVLMQFPNCLLFYGGLTIVYVLPYLEEEWITYEASLLAKQEEKKRLKLEKKKASRV